MRVPGVIAIAAVAVTLATGAAAADEPAVPDELAQAVGALVHAAAYRTDTDFGKDHVFTEYQAP
jgi:hypothetical protein